MIKITIEQIKYFLTLEKYRNFSLASYELCISQSSLSKHIKSLENEFNVILFNRTTRNIKLTNAGEDFLEYANKIIVDYNDIMLNMKKYSEKETSKIRMGTIPVLAQYNITPKIINFKNQQKYIDLDIIEKESKEIINMIKNNKLDLALVRNINLSDDEFNILDLIEDELVIVTSKNHRFTKKKYISFEELKDENFILLGENSTIHDKFIDECLKYNFSPNIIYRMYKIETILSLVSENIGITILMKKVINSFNTSNISISLLKDQIVLPLSLIYNKKSKLSKECLEFIEFIKKT